MSQADLEINRDIRKVLVRHWIDLGKLSFRSSNGRVWVRGSLQRIAGVQEELTPTLVEAIFGDAKKIRGVVTISTELENWVVTAGRWRSLDKSKAKAALVEEVREQQTTVQDIADTD